MIRGRTYMVILSFHCQAQVSYLQNAFNVSQGEEKGKGLNVKEGIIVILSTTFVWLQISSFSVF